MHNSFNALQLGVFGEGILGKFHQPGTNDRAIIPYFSYFLIIEIERALLKHFKAFTDRSHHAVLDSVMNHL
ncbi:hypothetical protein D3C71_1907720 [compost metagenome]